MANLSASPLIHFTDRSMLVLQLSVAEYVNGSIPEKRDPVFQTMYNAVESAINKCAFTFDTEAC
jgi:hypothetical protein